MAFAPLGFDLDALLGIFDRGVEFAHRRVARGAVGVEDCGLGGDGSSVSVAWVELGKCGVTRGFRGGRGWAFGEGHEP